MPFSKEIQARRRSGITATDAAPIAGLSPWRTAADVWVEKKHPELTIEFEESEALYWGNKEEPLIRDEYMKVTGTKVEKPEMATNAEKKWLMCSPDGVISGRKKGLECKAVSGMNRREWGPPGTDQIPMHYLIQVAFSMLVTGFKEWDVAAKIDLSDFRIYHIFWDDEMIRYLYEIVEEFYTRYIIGNERPDFDAGKGMEAMIAARWPKHVKGKELNVDANGDDKLRRALTALRNIKRMIKDCNAEEPIYRATIESYMGDHERIKWTTEKLGVLWRSSPAKPKIDWHAVAEEVMPLVQAPEQLAAILKKHTEKGEDQRRFLFQDKDKSAEEDDE